MKLNNKLLELNATATVYHGVELYKDQTGVTAKISASNHMISVLFDGNMAQIDMTGMDKLNSRYIKIYREVICNPRSILLTSFLGCNVINWSSKLSL